MGRRRSAVGRLLFGAAALWGLGVACSSFTSDVPDTTAPEAGADAIGVADASVVTDAASAYAAAVLLDHPIAYWRMNGSDGGLVDDESGHGHALELRAASVGNGAGYVLDQVGATNDGDRSILFDGERGFATSDLGGDFPFAAAHPFSVELWAAQTDAGVVAAIASGDIVSAPGRSGLILYSSEHTLRTTRNVDGGGPTASGATVDLSAFHHVVSTFDGVTLTLYVDEDDGITAISDGSLSLPDASFAVGRDDAYANDYYPGRLDEVAVYDYALSADRVRAHFRAAMPGGM